MCDTSQNGLGVVLEQLGAKWLRLISFASRYLSEDERKSSNNELVNASCSIGAD